MRRSLIGFSLVAALTITLAPPSLADSFSLSPGEATPLLGVSPFAEIANSEQDRVFYGSTNPQGWAYALCTGADCTAPTVLPFDFGNDFTAVTLTNGQRRAYFVSPSQSEKRLSTALVTYDSFGMPQLGPVTDLGISASREQRAWGVPDSVVLPDGRVRLYWVTMPEGGEAAATARPTRKQLKCLTRKLGKARVEALKKGSAAKARDRRAMRACGLDPKILSAGTSGGSDEVIVSATSTDSSGTTFVQDPGYRFTGGYVDSEILQAQDGDWVALVSTGPGSPPQQLFAATSADGLTWTLDQEPLTSPSVNALDPTGIAYSGGLFKIYWSQSPAATPFDNHTVLVGTLTRDR